MALHGSHHLSNLEAASTIVSEFLAHPSCSCLKLVGGSPRRRLPLDLRRRLGQADSRSTLCPTRRMFSLAELATGRVLPNARGLCCYPFSRSIHHNRFVRFDEVSDDENPRNYFPRMSRKEFHNCRGTVSDTSPGL